MRFLKVAAALTLGVMGALGASTGCTSPDPNAGTTSGNPPPDVTCALKDTCVSADPTCVAIVDNKDQQQFGLRMSQILISKPASLGPTTFVGKVVSGGVALNRPECYLTGDAAGGNFSWLLHFDLATNTVCTGGAKPPTAAEDGYSFVNEMLLGRMVEPIKVATDLSTGTFGITDGLDVVVPIYTAEGSPILLPLRKARIFDAKLSSNNNCVGSFNAAGLDPFANCGPVPADNQFSFVNGGKLDGYITLEDADGIVVDLANASLCKLLTGKGDGGTPIEKCARDAAMKIDYQGDWCDATNAAATADCSDSVQLAAEFAASAVKINGGCPIP